ncbi:MAG: cytochrome c biogenesis protein CcsA [Anaerolineales bacterium]|nr:cytochrome c biogenesis protein CcsA [Anaerolineales bacterium]
MPKAGRAVTILNVVTAVMMLIAIGMVFFYAPQEKTMGEVQRIFYFHVPSAWLSFTAFAITAVAGGIYLATGKQFWDQVAYSSVEVGLVLTVMATMSGSIWARPAWNTWWTWDPRLTTYTIMALIYVAYLMLRQGIEDPQRRARFAAVYGIIGVISVPLTFFSIRWWRTIHPVVIGNGSASSEGGFDMTARMLQTFLFANLAFTFLYVALLVSRVRLARLGERVEELKARLLTA